MLEFGRAGFAYTPGHWVFREVTARLEAGEVMAVLGPNGRGKSTLLRCAAGLAKPTEGSVTHRARTAYVPQAGLPSFTYRVIDMVLMGRVRHVRAWSVPGRADHAAAARALDRVGAAHLAERGFAELSGGERQLVLIARALAAEADVLVLDEPASALDLRNQAQVLALLRALAAEGIASMVSTHHPDHAEAVADSVLLMFGARDVRAGPAADLLNDQALSELYEIEVRSVCYSRNGRTRHAFTTGDPS